MSEDMKAMIHELTSALNEQKAMTGRWQDLLLSSNASVNAAFEMLEYNGIRREHARTLRNGIDVLATRLTRQIRARDDDIERLRAELAQANDILTSYQSRLTLLAGALDVPYEPHQTYEERLLEAVQNASKALAQIRNSTEKGEG